VLTAFMAFLDIQIGIDGKIAEILNNNSLRLSDNAGVCSHYRFPVFVGCPEENARK
jgi:hypothetical protein